MKNDLFGNRMKLLEGQESDRKFIPLLPICIRLDGKGFSAFTKGLQRPFDPRMIKLMQEVALFLCKETNSKIGYTQSDEISLILYSDTYESLPYFNGRIQKIVSILAGLATAKFNELKIELLPEKANKLAVFDCRAWQVPTLWEAANNILWRAQDATKNSISMAAQHYYSHKELLNKNSKIKKEMLLVKDICWDNYPDHFKYGTFIQKRSELRNEVERFSYKIIDMPSFNSVLNRTEVIFNRQSPITLSSRSC